MFLSNNNEDFCFIDFESCGLPGTEDSDLAEVKVVGLDVYGDNAFPVMLTYCIGDSDVDILALDDFNRRLSWDDFPVKLKDFYKKAANGQAWFVAWNMGFDRRIWNCDACNFPPLSIDMTIDAMVQAMSSGLPLKLNDAGADLGLGEKHTGGKYMSLFSKWGAGTPSTHPEQWREYKHYGIKDTELLRDVFFSCRPLPKAEWEDYWVSEAINERGIGVDVFFAKRAVAVAEYNASRMDDRLRLLTDGTITGVSQVGRICAWVYDNLSSTEARNILHKPDGVGGYKLSLDKNRIERLIAFFESKESLTALDKKVSEVLNIRYYGGSTAHKKFNKIVTMSKDGVLRNSYVFNGGGQTGRFSSRGVQVHNLIRKSLGENEAEFIDAISFLDV